MLAMFVLGACTSVAASSVAAPEQREPDSTSGPIPSPTSSPETHATVIDLAAAPSATAPSATATITHLARGQNAYLGLLRMDADAAVPVHRDPTEEYIHVLEGGGVMIIDGERHTITAGTTIFMPANAEVSFQNGAEPMVAIQVFAGPDPAAKYDAWQPRP
jgi:quercetin dioxygenase-like cupin family protein